MQIKNLLIIGLLSLAFLTGQNLFAQTDTVKKAASADEMRADVTGLMIKKFKKKKHSGGGGFTARRTRYSEYTYKFDSFRFADVNYDPQSQEWKLNGEAADSRTGKVVKMWIIYQEWNSLLQISLTREKNIMWKIPKTDKIKVTIPEDKSSFRIDFVKSIEGIDPAGSNHHWIQESWLLAQR